jgi:hypothetical protein
MAVTTALWSCADATVIGRYDTLRALLAAKIEVEADVINLNDGFISIADAGLLTAAGDGMPVLLWTSWGVGRYAARLRRRRSASQPRLHESCLP